MWNTFKLMTSLSMADVHTIGSTIGFYPDDPLAWTYSAVASPDGIGVCNNTNYGSNSSIGSTVTGVFTRYKSGLGNEGFLRRQTFINYDADGDVDGGAGALTYASLLTATNASTLWKSHISQKVSGLTGAFQISVRATVYLKHIHSFFQMIPLLKGVYMKMTLTLNNSSTTVGTDATNFTSVTSTVPVGGVLPLMIASKATSNGSVASMAVVGGSYTASISVGSKCLTPAQTALAGVVEGKVGSNIFLYVPAYSFNPPFEQAYLSSPIKTIEYTDVYQYQVPSIAVNGSVNQLLTNGLANVKSVLVIPFHSSVAGNPNLPVYQSPFDPAGCGPTSPLCLLTNFNVVVSGQNAIYNTERYSFEQFNNQLLGVNAVNGGMVDGLTSGLIDQLGFEMEYCYYYIDVSRMLPVEESVPKSVQIVGQNASAIALSLWCFVEYGISMSVDLLTGARV